jgi:hypothetical protein
MPVVTILPSFTTGFGEWDGFCRFSAMAGRIVQGQHWGGAMKAGDRCSRFVLIHEKLNE